MVALPEQDVSTAELAYATLPGLIKLAREDCPTFLEMILKDEESGEDIYVEPFQVEWHRAIQMYKNVVLWTHPDSGKAVPLSTPIPTPEGWTTMGDLNVGDLVFGRDGKPCRVTWCSPIQHDRPVYRITFDDGAVIDADEEHRWIAKSRRDRFDKKPWRVVTTKQMLDTLRVEKDQRVNWAIPLTQPIEYDEVDLPIEPYVLGVWLGDGTAQGSEVTYPEFDSEIIELCGDLEGIGTPYQRATCMGVTLGPAVLCKVPICARLRQLNLKNNKHIPEIYLRASQKQRWALLYGLMDTDGFAAKDYPTSEFSTSIPALRDGFFELTRSLGLKVSMSVKKTYRKDSYRFRITSRKRLFMLARKHNRMMDACKRSKPNATTSMRYVKDIQRIESVPVRCITVDSHDNSYVMGRDYIVTHNTQEISIGLLVWLLGKDPRKRFAVLSASRETAQKIVRLIKNHIENNPVVRAIFPELKPGAVWSEVQIEVARPDGIKDPSVQAFSPDSGAIQGSRLDGLVIDDVLTAVNTWTAYQRDKLDAWIRSSAFSRLSDDAFVAFLTNAWHIDDMAHRLEKQGWWAKRYPVLNTDGTPAYPRRWPISRIEKARDRLRGDFDRQMMCEARDETNARFKRAWIDTCLERGEGYSTYVSLEDIRRRDVDLAAQIYGVTVPEMRVMDAAIRLGDVIDIGPEGFSFVTGVDLAVSKKDSADLTVLFTILVWPDGTRHVIEIISGRWYGPEIVKHIVSAHYRFNSTIVVETNAAQAYVYQYAKLAAPSMSIKSFITGRNKFAPEYGIESLAAELSEGLWVIPCARSTRVPSREIYEWIREMVDYDPKQHVGDRLMAGWIAREFARTLDQKTNKTRRRGGRGVRIIGSKRTDKKD